MLPKFSPFVKMWLINLYTKFCFFNWCCMQQKTWRWTVQLSWKVTPSHFNNRINTNNSTHSTAYPFSVPSTIRQVPRQLCQLREQQEALLKTENLAGVYIKCTKPKATSTTEGVVKPIPIAADVESLTSEPTIREVHRLTHRDRTKSQAVRLTFCLNKLLQLFKVDCQEFVAHRYVPLVRQCTKWKRLGHLKAQCRSRVQVCPPCRGQDHSSSKCKKQPKCVNCKGPFLAAFQGCPHQKVRLILVIANRIWYGTFIPYSEALRRATQTWKQKDRTSSQSDSPASQWLLAWGNRTSKNINSSSAMRMLLKFKISRPPGHQIKIFAGQDISSPFQDGPTRFLIILK